MFREEVTSALVAIFYVGPHITGQIGIWREENRISQRKTGYPRGKQDIPEKNRISQRKTGYPREKQDIPEKNRISQRKTVCPREKQDIPEENRIS